MIKKLSIVGLIILLMFVFVGCDTDDAEPEEIDEPDEIEEEPEEEAEEEVSEEEVTLDFYWVTANAPDDPYAIAANAFKDLAEEKSNGRIQVRLYPDGQLGGERDAIEGMSMGTIDIGVITNAPFSGFLPAFQVLDLPFIFSDESQAHVVLDGPFGDELLSKLDQINIKGFGFAEGGFRQMINNTRPVYTPDDVVGVKYRVMENPIYIGMFDHLGSDAIPMAWGETFTAVQQGVMDGLEIPIPVIHQNSYYEVCDYLSLTNHTYSPLPFVMSQQVWEQLPADLQNIVEESAKEAIVIQRAQNAENTGRLLAELEELGMEVNEIEDTEMFREKVEPLFEEFADEIGRDIIEMLFEAIQ